jgi:hypothetical protein
MKVKVKARGGAGKVKSEFEKQFLSPFTSHSLPLLGSAAVPHTVRRTPLRCRPALHRFLSVAPAFLRPEILEFVCVFVVCA